MVASKCRPGLNRCRTEVAASTHLMVAASRPTTTMPTRGARYWISGCKKRGGDRLYPGVIHIDEDVREEYWVKIRNMPDNKHESVIKCRGKYGGKRGRK